MCEYFFCRQKKNNNKKAGTFLHIFAQLDLLFNLHLSVLAHKTFFVEQIVLEQHFISIWVRQILERASSFT